MRAMLPALLNVVDSSIPSRSEEPHTFPGETVEAWLAVFRDEASSDPSPFVRMWAAEALERITPHQ